MAGKRPNTKKSSGSAPLEKAPKKPRLSSRYDQDDEYASWFRSVEYKKTLDGTTRKRRLVVSTFEKDGRTITVARQKSEPLDAKSLVKDYAKATGLKKLLELRDFAEVWQRSVAPEIAAESRVFAYKDGILTVDVFNSPLLQEIKQFHKDGILATLRKNWILPLPLDQVKFRLAKG